MKLLPNNFYSFPAIANTTMSSEDLKELLLNTEGWALIRGHIRNWCVQSVGRAKKI